MLFSFLVTVREGVEIALIVVILLGYLRSIGQRRYFSTIWLGVGVAAAACVAVGAGLELAARELSSSAMEAFEGGTMLLAVALLTMMAFWMKRQSSGISRELREQVARALGRGSVAALVLLAASSVGREGLETTLFLFAGSKNGEGGLPFLLGGVLGFAVAAAIEQERQATFAVLRASEEEERRLQPFAAHRRGRQQHQRGHRSPAERLRHLLAQLTRDAARLPFHPERHHRQQRHGEQHRAALERFHGAGAQLARGKLQPSANGHARCRGNAHAQPDRAEVPPLAYRPQIPE